MLKKKITKQISYQVKLIVIIACAWSTTITAKDLVDIIPSLYGGDGVQLATASTGFTHAPHFQDDALIQLNKLTQAATDIQFPYPNASGGISYSYDPVLDEFVKNIDANSLLFTNPARTLGKGRFSGGISYSNISYDKLDGQNINKLSLTLDHEDLAGPGSDICIGGDPPNCFLFEDDKVLLDIDMLFDSEILFLFGSYGITDSIDLEVILPIIKNRFSINSTASIHDNETKQFFQGTLHYFDENGINGDGINSHGEENKIGFGDLKINSKWNFYSSAKTSLSSLIEILIPTGDEDNFMGSDTFSVKPSILVSAYPGMLNLPLYAHFNLGYGFTTGGSSNELSYAGALEYHYQFSNNLIATAFEIIGQHVLETRTGFGDDQIDAAVGGKWFFLENQTIFFNYRFPLNDEGLRASNIFSVGYAATF